MAFRSQNLVFALLALSLAGCGGGGSHRSSSSGSTPNALAGSYTGTYDSEELGDSGTVTLTISDGGSLSGTATSDAFGASGPLSGNVSSSGTFTGKVKLSGQSQGTLDGPLVKNSNGTVTGPITETINGTSGTVTFTLTPTTSG